MSVFDGAGVRFRTLGEINEATLAELATEWKPYTVLRLTGLNYVIFIPEDTTSQVSFCAFTDQVDEFLVLIRDHQVGDPEKMYRQCSDLQLRFLTAFLSREWTLDADSDAEGDGHMHESGADMHVLQSHEMLRPLERACIITALSHEDVRTEAWPEPSELLSLYSITISTTSVARVELEIADEDRGTFSFSYVTHAGEALTIHHALTKTSHLSMFVEDMGNQPSAVFADISMCDEWFVPCPHGDDH